MGYEIFLNFFRGCKFFFDFTLPDFYILVISLLLGKILVQLVLKRALYPLDTSLCLLDTICHLTLIFKHRCYTDLKYPYQISWRYVLLFENYYGSSHRRCSIKKVSLKISQFLKHFPQACNFIEKRLQYR